MFIFSPERFSRSPRNCVHLAPESAPYLKTSVRVVCRARSRFPRFLERLRKPETEWTDWKEASRAQGRQTSGSAPAVWQISAADSLYELLYELFWEAMRKREWLQDYSASVFNNCFFRFAPLRLEIRLLTEGSVNSSQLRSLPMWRFLLNTQATSAQVSEHAVTQSHLGHLRPVNHRAGSKTSRSLRRLSWRLFGHFSDSECLLTCQS